METLRLSRFIPAPPDRVFNAWTDPDEMRKWWGPQGVNCLAVEIDLRVGGQYRIANELPDKSVLWISGEFEAIKKPHRLTYTWIVENEKPTKERVDVQFERQDVGTRVTITHERISTKALKEQHHHGWMGCMDGLVGQFTNPRP